MPSLFAAVVGPLDSRACLSNYEASLSNYEAGMVSALNFVIWEAILYCRFACKITKYFNTFRARLRVGSSEARKGLQKAFKICPGGPK